MASTADVFAALAANPAFLGPAGVPRNALDPKTVAAYVGERMPDAMQQFQQTQYVQARRADEAARAAKAAGTGGPDPAAIASRYMQSLPVRDLRGGVSAMSNQMNTQSSTPGGDAASPVAFNSVPGYVATHLQNTGWTVQGDMLVPPAAATAPASLAGEFTGADGRVWVRTESGAVYLKGTEPAVDPYIGQQDSGQVVDDGTDPGVPSGIGEPVSGPGDAAGGGAGTPSAGRDPALPPPAYTFRDGAEIPRMNVSSPTGHRVTIRGATGTRNFANWTDAVRAPELERKAADFYSGWTGQQVMTPERRFLAARTSGLSASQQQQQQRTATFGPTQATAVNGRTKHRGYDTIKQYFGNRSGSSSSSSSRFTGGPYRQSGQT